MEGNDADKDNDVPNGSPLEVRADSCQGHFVQRRISCNKNVKIDGIKGIGFDDPRGREDEVGYRWIDLDSTRTRASEER